MTCLPPFAHPLASGGEARLCLGASRHPGTGWRRRDGEVWLVAHRDPVPWTAVWRLDARDRRTVHLERSWDGDRWAEAICWAAQTFALDPRTLDEAAAEPPLALVA